MFRPAPRVNSVRLILYIGCNLEDFSKFVRTRGELCETTGAGRGGPGGRGARRSTEGAPTQTAATLGRRPTRQESLQHVAVILRKSLAAPRLAAAYDPPRPGG